MSKTTKIEISFGAPVDFPEGWERGLDAMLMMVCAQFQRDNPGYVMWPSGCGSKPLGPIDDGVKFDDSVYFVECHAREDYHGENPHNPEREKIAKARHEAERARRVIRPKAIGVSRVADAPDVLCVQFENPPTDEDMRALHAGLSGRRVA